MFLDRKLEISADNRRNKTNTNFAKYLLYLEENLKAPIKAFKFRISHVSNYQQMKVLTVE